MVFSLCNNSILLISPTLSISVSDMINLTEDCPISKSSALNDGWMFSNVIKFKSRSIFCSPFPSLRSYTYKIRIVYSLLDNKPSNDLTSAFSATTGLSPSCNSSIFLIYPTSSVSVSLTVNSTLVLV